ncbi:hypothetical protein BUALT_Bualt18G0060600 [Buddleja alternifolia]|uniref:Reverse transcriptase domain-containing protein n=1 Tax=Buddleja alternifolia TaxID=168488 RepID=A0AAV6W8K5_9LAMI|nr:hypothetical protein BUALT_Bualt18G0060600 [Buddleja alternifolia]
MDSPASHRPDEDPVSSDPLHNDNTKNIDMRDVPMGEEGEQETSQNNQGKPPTYSQKLMGDNREWKPSKFNSATMKNLDKVHTIASSSECPHSRVVLKKDYVSGITHSWEDNIILKWEGKFINYNVLATKIDTLWSLKGLYELLEIGNNCYILKLKDKTKMESILTAGPWIIFNNHLGVRKWCPKFHASKDKALTTMSWVRIPELAIEYYQEEIIYSITKCLGTPVKIDHNTLWAAKGKFARFCVQIDLAQPLQSDIEVDGTVYNLVYENLPTICFLWPQKNECPLATRTEINEELKKNKDNGEEESEKTTGTETKNVETPVKGQDGKQFGEWMQVARPKTKQNRTRLVHGKGNSREGPQKILNKGLRNKNAFNALANTEDSQLEDLENVCDHRNLENFAFKGNSSPENLNGKLGSMVQRNDGKSGGGPSNLPTDRNDDVSPTLLATVGGNEPLSSGSDRGTTLRDGGTSELGRSGETRGTQDLIIQKLIHLLRKSKSKTGGMVLKNDLEKAYDRVSWSFLHETLDLFKFLTNVTRLIMDCVMSSRPRILWNREPLPPFQPSCGLRQGDPLSPYLFVLCMERLGYMIEEATWKGRWKPVAMCRGGPKISHLFFADDLLLTAKVTLSNAWTIKDVLDEFCGLSGLKVNISKSKIFFSKSTSWRNRRRVASRLGFGGTNDLGKYLGVPIVHHRASPRIYRQLVDKGKSGDGYGRNQCPPKFKIFHWLIHRNRLATRTQLFHRGKVCWKKPDKGWLKLNTDGSFRSTTGCATAGGLLRDDKGMWQWAEVDSDIVCKLIHNGDVEVHPLGNIIQDVRVLLRMPWRSTLQHTKHEGNQGADMLAKLGHDLHDGVHMWEKPPNECMEVLSAEM